MHDFSENRVCEILEGQPIKIKYAAYRAPIFDETAASARAALPFVI